MCPAGDSVYTDSNEVVRETVNGRLFEYRAGEFFQNNPFALPRLVEYTLGQAAHGTVWLVWLVPWLAIYWRQSDCVCISWCSAARN